MTTRRRDFILGSSAAALSLQSRLGFGADGRILEIETGKLRGADLGGVHAFKGIPYGAATQGARRFMPCSKSDHWTGVRDATQVGASAPQLRLPGQVVPPWVAFCEDPAGTARSEDCLVVNVWTPTPDAAKRPVMFWIHGGGYTVGSASPPSYDGANLARSQNVVVVSLNHRLNALGFLDLSAIPDTRFADAGNVGLLDIIAALQWVRTNIHVFGGDPGCVTIFGESGGGSKVSHLLAMPAAKGLFHRAIVESGPGIRSGTHEANAQSTGLLLAELGLTSATAVDKLQQVPLEQFMAAANRVAAKGAGRGFGPVVDGKNVPHHPFDPSGPSESATVPVIVGYNHTETTFLRIDDTEGFTLDETRLKERLQQMAGDRAQQIFSAYQSAYPKASAPDLNFYITTDATMGNGSHLLAERKAALGQAPVYVYRFDWMTPVEGGRMRSAHTVEIPFVFNTISLPIVQKSLGSDPRNTELASKICGLWATFARTGDPKFAGLPTWRPYNATARPTMLFDYASQCVDDPQGEARRTLLPLPPTTGRA
jgi:para-nitrobenzyl esterase